VVPCGWRDRWTDMMKLTVTSQNFANMPNKMDRRETGCGKVKLSELIHH